MSKGVGKNQNFRSN